MEISIIIPVYNEENTIKEVIDNIKKVTSRLNKKTEIIVVNDYSKDKSENILKNITGITLINHKINRGYGASLKTGIKVAKGKWILVTDADGTYPTEEILSLIKYVEGYDMVVGSRGRGNINIPLMRRPAKWFLNKFASFLVGAKIPDLNSGLRIFNKEKCLEFWNLYPNKFSFTSTITVAFFSRGYKVKYIPIDYLKRKGKSTISPFDFYNFNNLLLRLTLLFNPIKIFTSISAFLILIAVAIGIYSICFMDEFMDITVILLALSSLQIFLFGLIAHIIVKYK